MPRRDSNSRLRDQARLAIYELLGRDIKRQIEDKEPFDALEFFRAFPKMVNLIDFALTHGTREQLSPVADWAVREGIQQARKQQAVSNEDSDILLSVRSRMKAGLSERRACEDEARSRGCTTAKELAVFRVEYRRIVSRIRKILAPLGLDPNQL